MSSPRRYPWLGMAVNPLCPEPAPPGPWVDAERCEVCAARVASGELEPVEHWTGRKRRRRGVLWPHLYRDHRGGYGFAEATHRLRQSAKGEGDDGGGYRSRRSVLWWLRVLKLEDWYQTHGECGRTWADGFPELEDIAEPLDLGEGDALLRAEDLAWLRWTV